IEAEALRAMAPFALMARAGDAVARLALAIAPHAERVLVFAGPGNNGGDGLAAATRLRALGKDAAVVLLGDAAALPADAAQAPRRAQQAGVPISPWPRDAAPAPELVIDALLGIGAPRAPAGALAEAVRASAAHAA